MWFYVVSLLLLQANDRVFKVRATSAVNVTSDFQIEDDILSNNQASVSFF
jgi:hypothetical protein